MDFKMEVIMVHAFKANGERYVFDRGSGKVTPVSAMQYRMISYLKPPLTPELPTALRYNLAKYDGGAVTDAYDALYALFEAGALFSEKEAPDACAGCWASGLCSLGGECEGCAAERQRLELALASGEKK